MGGEVTESIVVNITNLAVNVANIAHKANVLTQLLTRLKKYPADWAKRRKVRGLSWRGHRLPTITSSSGVLTWILFGAVSKAEGMSARKRFYKSYEILYAFDKGPEILNELATGLLNLDPIARLDLFFTYFSQEKHPFMYLYPEDRITLKMPTREFVERELSQYYSLVCAWQESKNEPSARLLCDAFQGNLSTAWAEMRGKTGFQVVYGGDACEPLIAATDIALKVIDLELDKKGLQLRKEHVKDALTSLGYSRQVDVTFVGDIRSLIPISRKSINFTSELLHPIVFVVPEGLPSLEIEGKRMTESDVIRNSPKYRNACNLAYDQRGAVKIFEPRDLRTIQAGDLFVPTGENSRKYARHLKELGHDIKIRLEK